MLTMELLLASSEAQVFTHVMHIPPPDKDWGAESLPTHIVSLDKCVQKNYIMENFAQDEEKAVKSITWIYRLS